MNIMWAAFRPNGDIVRDTVRNTRSEAMSEAVKYCIPGHAYYTLGTDSKRWRRARDQGYYLSRVVVTEAGSEVGK